ncbi:MAG: iron uptake porin [Rivularia sp. (in: Bacteria)]|nr:iron uptake porin [Rivularia sp. MS3]
MRDISLLMASVLTTGQTTVPELPEELPEQPENTQRQLEQNQEASVILSPKIAAPEFVESDNTLEAINEKCDRNHCDVTKQFQTTQNSSSQSTPTVITLSEYKIEYQKELNKYQNKIQFKDYLASIEEAQQTVLPQKSNLEASKNSGDISISNQLDNQKHNLITQNLETETQESQNQNIFPNSGNISRNQFLEPENPMSQVTSVSELDDVSPTDWAFEALQSLASRHNCALAYPDGTFQGQKIINRYQFATGIDACLQQINELIVRNGASAINEQDLIILQRLQNEFRAELNQLEERIISLEERTGELQANQFSPTTRFFGQVTTSLQGTNTNEVDLFPRDGVPERTAQTNLTFANSMQLTLATSFTGRDLLLTGLYAGNLGSSASSLFTNMGRLNFESDTGNDILINDLSYRFPISNNLGVVVGAAGVNPTSTFRGINSLEGEAISSFAQRNPIIGIGSGTGGVGFDWQINNRISLQGVYSSQFPSFPTDKNVGGLFGGRQTLGTQLTVTPVNNIDVGLNYLYSRSPDSLLATGIGDAQLISPFAPDTAFDTQAIGATVAYRINPNFQIGGWGGWTFSDPKDIQGSVTTNNWAVFAAFPNLGKPGNLGGIMIGQPPKITSSTLPDGFNFPNFSNSGTPGGRDGTSLHVEMFYRAKLNRNLDITPGFFVVFNPDHNQSNDALIVGALKATFRF